MFHNLERLTGQPSGGWRPATWSCCTAGTIPHVLSGTPSGHIRYEEVAAKMLPRIRGEVADRSLPDPFMKCRSATSRLTGLPTIRNTTAPSMQTNTLPGWICSSAKQPTCTGAWERES